MFTTDGTYVESWGVSGNGPGEFDLTRANGDPYGDVVFSRDGSFHVLDPGNRRVQRFDRDRKYLLEWGGFGEAQGQFVDPIGIAIDADGRINVLDDTRRVIETFDADGSFVRSIPAFGGTGSDVANSLAIGPDGHFFVAVVDPNEVIELDADGRVVRTFGRPGSGEGAFNEQPMSLAFDSVGRMYATQGPGRGDRPGVLVFDRDGTYLGGFGPVGVGRDELGFPCGIVVDDDAIYVADAGSQPDIGLESFIRRFEPIDWK